MRITSSSISSSEGRWASFARAWLAAALGGTALLLGLAAALDPYDTGRFALFDKPGVRPQGPRTANASRGRDPAFDAAVIGNSHVQMLSPERLSTATGHRFVQLATPGTKAGEQIALIVWFLRHRPGTARALVVGVDPFWCTPDAGLTPDRPFPFWLYGANPLAHLGGLLRLDTLEELPRRIAYLTRRDPPRARPDGFWDYEAEFLGRGFRGGPAHEAKLRAELKGDVPANPNRRFPAFEALARALPPPGQGPRLILVHPPVFAPVLPRPGSPEAEVEGACKAEARRLARERGGAVVDGRVDDPRMRDPESFFDQAHYRRPLAQELEAEIAARLAALR
ncbi:MAG TPA: hypothetical protein VIL65_16470 [Beijerinckiaceae bacterium]|jgi:hypothetical protein